MIRLIPIRAVLTVHRVALAYGAALVLGYLVFGFVGFILPMTESEDLAPATAASALTFAFSSSGDAVSDWFGPEGTTSRTWLSRRAFIRGYRGSAAPARYTEQVLKVGWPFTSVRGFLRTVGGEIRSVGVILVQGRPVDGPVRFWPLQPVWPGLIFNSVWITVVVLFISAVRVGGRTPEAVSA